MVMTTGACQGRPIQCLEEVVDKTVVASRMIRQCFGCNNLIRSTDVALNTHTKQHWLQNKLTLYFVRGGSSSLG